jgi:hypothetical protein
MLVLVAFVLAQGVQMAWAAERRNVAHLLLVGSHAGSTPASLRISQTVDAAIFTPSTRSSPWIRRYPQVVFSRAKRRTSRRTDRIVGGRLVVWAGNDGHTNIAAATRRTARAPDRPLAMINRVATQT